jgi:hypothetical protein
LARQYARLQTHGARAAVAMAVEESQT